MPVIALTFAVIIPLLIAAKYEQSGQQEKKKDTKEVHNTQKLFERGKFKDKYLMTSEEYPFYENKPAAGDRRLTKTNMTCIEDSDLSFGNQ